VVTTCPPQISGSFDVPRRPIEVDIFARIATRHVRIVDVVENAEMSQ
jgi:hypothetical protein